MTYSTTWKRTEHGYLSADGEWFLVRGARMSTGGTNAWLIHRRVSEDVVGRDALSCYDLRNGQVLWRLSDGATDTADPDFTGDLYAHDNDAGSLAEAKFTAALLFEKEN